MDKKRLLVVGGTGFLGKHILKKGVQLGFKSHSISLKIPKGKLKIKGVKYLSLDIRNKKNLNTIKDKFQYVVNVSGYGGFNKNYRDSKNSDAQFTGLKNLAAFFLNKKIKKFIQIGSSLEYGKNKSPNKENMISNNPLTEYGKLKLNSTIYLKLLYKFFNFPTVTFRLYQVYGPEQKQDRLIPMVINSCLENSRFNCSSGIQVKDFLYITDAIDAISKCFNNNKIIGKIINVGSGQKISIKNLILKIIREIGFGKPIFGVLKMRSDEPKKSYPSIKKAKKILLWKPKISLEKGLRMTISYYKDKKGKLLNER